MSNPHKHEDLELPHLSEAQMQKGLDELKRISPEAIAKMAKTLKKMDPRLMQSVFRSQGIEIEPEQIAKMADVLTPQAINMISSTLGKQNPVSEEHKAEEVRVGRRAEKHSDMYEVLSDPQQSQAACEMLAKQLGRQPEDVRSVLVIIRAALRLRKLIINTFLVFTTGNRKYFTFAAVMVLFSYYLGLLANPY